MAIVAAAMVLETQAGTVGRDSGEDGEFDLVPVYLVYDTRTYH